MEIGVYNLHAFCIFSGPYYTWLTPNYCKKISRMQIKMHRVIPDISTCLNKSERTSVLGFMEFVSLVCMTL